MFLTTKETVENGDNLVKLSFPSPVFARVSFLGLGIFNIGRRQYNFLSIGPRVIIFNVWVVLKVTDVNGHLSFCDYRGGRCASLSVSCNLLLGLLGCSCWTTFSDLHLLPLLTEGNSRSGCASQHLSGHVASWREILVWIKCKKSLIGNIVLKISCFRFMVPVQPVNGECGHWRLHHLSANDLCLDLRLFDPLFRVSGGNRRCPLRLSLRWKPWFPLPTVVEDSLVWEKFLDLRVTCIA